MSDEPERISVPPTLPAGSSLAASAVQAHGARVALRLAADLVRATVAAEFARLAALEAQPGGHPTSATFGGERATLRRSLADAEHACDAIATVAGREGAP